MSTKRRPTTGALVESYLSERRKLGRIGTRTVCVQRSCLAGFIAVAPHHADKITRRTVVRYMGSIRHLSANTRRQYHGIVAGFCAWLRARGVITVDAFRDVPAPATTRPLHRALDGEQVARLVAACVDERELVVLMLGLHAGLRRAEMASLEVGDISIAARTVIVRKGKGGHARVVPLAEEACRIVGRYIAIEQLDAGPLLRDRRSPQKGIGPAAVGRMFRLLAVRAGVKIRNRDGVATHALRHTAATDIYTACRDIMAVADVLGHEQLTTTRRYVRGLDTERLRDAVEGRHYAV